MERHCATCGDITTKSGVSLFVCAAGHENWINPVVGSIMCVVRDGEVLFGVRSVQPNSGKLSLPGGFVDVGETAEQAAVREAKEELGIDTTILSCLGTYATTYGDRPILNIVYVAGCEDEPAIIPGDDMNGGEPIWCKIDDLPSADDLAWEWYRFALADLQTWWQKQKMS